MSQDAPSYPGPLKRQCLEGGEKSRIGGKGKGKGYAQQRDPTERYSRCLTRILRHSAKQDGIPIDTAGWVDVGVLLQRQEFQDLSLSQVQKIVQNCNKQRFCLKEEDGKHFIRANQGHSFEVPELDLVRITSEADAPLTVIHGTYYDAWNTIQKVGLCKMKRQHIHFAAGLPGEGGVISGMRASAQILIFLNVAKCLEDNVPLWRSANNVILCPGLGPDGVLPMAYVKWVEDVRLGKVLYGAKEL